MNKTILLALGIIAVVLISGCVGTNSVCKVNPREHQGCEVEAVYKCGDYYRVIPACEDVGYDYVDSNGNVIASCGGFSNLPEEPECSNLNDLTCNYDINICEK